jgi:hypothetical protein
MITARSSIVDIPPGHYAKIAQVIGNVRKLKQNRPHKPHKCHKRNRQSKEYYKILGGLWLEEMELQDPDGLMEGWTR